MENWINFENQEPSIDQEVVFGKNNMFENDVLLKPVVTVGHYLGEGKFYSWLSRNVLPASHWMPLPELKND